MGIMRGLGAGVVAIGLVGVGLEMASPGSSGIVWGAAQRSTSNGIATVSGVVEENAPKVGGAAQSLFAMIPQSAQALSGDTTNPQLPAAPPTSPSTTLPDVLAR